MKNLSEVESLAALYADKIIIIHETLSTAAEIGMFAGNKSLTSKICILFQMIFQSKKIRYQHLLNWLFLTFTTPKMLNPIE